MLQEKKLDKIDEKFLQLEKDLYDITYIFKEVHTMLLDQSYSIDTLEENLNIVREDTKSSLDNLKESADIKNSSLLPLIGSSIGFLVGGPVGLIISSKTGIICMGIFGSFSALIGSVTGYYICKL